MNVNWIALAVPLFLFLMGLEYVYARWRKKPFFRFNSSVANINVGIAERLLDTFTVGAFYVVYEYLHRHYALFDIRPGVWGWIGLFIATDFVWYWYHRLAHEVNLFWAAHVVHHQSEEFNYTVSARITVFQALIRTGFWSVLPIIGFPPGMITTLLLIHGLYPFFIHTRTISKLGWLEYVLVTPSHHRVHHASNPQYLDKNYGDVLIIWDKLFGTFVEEKEEPVYGLTRQLDSYSFLWQHFHFLLELLETVRRTPGLRAKVGVLFGRPDDVDPTIRELLEQRFLLRSPVHATSHRFRGYVVGQMAGILTLLFLLILFERQIPGVYQFMTAVFIVLTLVNVGAVLEQRRWVFYLEISRALVLWLGLYGLVRSPVLIPLTYVTVLSLWVHFRLVQRYYLQLVYGVT